MCSPLPRQVLPLLETQSGCPLRKVRNDRGGEYTSGALLEWLESKGVEPQKTAPYTPEQNGRAERLNRTLVERVRAILIDSKLPPNTWAEALLTVNYLRNRSPSSEAKGLKTPWELFFGSKPDVTLLRVFGSPAYPLIPKQLRKSKLHPVSRAGRFVGYEPGSKAYRILLDDGSIIVSRDVTFDERPVDTIPNPEPLGGVEDAIDPPDLSSEVIAPEEIAPEVANVPAPGPGSPRGKCPAPAPGPPVRNLSRPSPGYSRWKSSGSPFGKCPGWSRWLGWSGWVRRSGWTR